MAFVDRLGLVKLGRAAVWPLVRRAPRARRSMRVARCWCKRQGWTDVENVSNRRPWDLEALDGSGQKRYVEVKGERE